MTSTTSTEIGVLRTSKNLPIVPTTSFRGRLPTGRLPLAVAGCATGSARPLVGTHSLGGELRSLYLSHERAYSSSERRRRQATRGRFSENPFTEAHMKGPQQDVRSACLANGFAGVGRFVALWSTMSAGCVGRAGNGSA